jgi:flagellin-like hook-associated protein FlgL
MALETTAFTKYQILQQAGVAVLAQANASAQSVLGLLR